MVRRLTTATHDLRRLRQWTSLLSTEVPGGSFDGRPDLSPSVGLPHRTQEGALATLLAALRTSLIRDVAPSREIIRQAVTLTLAGRHYQADAEELETLLLILRGHLAALIEQAESVGPSNGRMGGLLPEARTLLGQSLRTDNVSLSRRQLIMQLSGMVDRIGLSLHSVT